MATELATQRIGFLGAGAMGEALAGGLIAAGVPCAHVRAADPDAARRDSVSRALGIVTGDTVDLNASGDTLDSLRVLTVSRAALAVVELVGP